MTQNHNVGFLLHKLSEVLDETADSKATVLKTEYSSQKVSDWDKASVSSCCWDRKSYDHLIQLKTGVYGAMVVLASACRKTSRGFVSVKLKLHKGSISHVY